MLSSDSGQICPSSSLHYDQHPMSRYVNQGLLGLRPAFLLDTHNDS